MTAEVYYPFMYKFDCVLTLMTACALTRLLIWLPLAIVNVDREATYTKPESTGKEFRNLLRPKAEE